MDFRLAILGSVGVLQAAVVVPVMQPHVIIAVDHDSKSLGVERLTVPHAPVPRRVVLQSNEHTLAKIPLEYRCSPGRLAVAELVRNTFWSAALAPLALASTVELL